MRYKKQKGAFFLFVSIGMLLLPQHVLAQFERHPVLNELFINNSSKPLGDEENATYWDENWLPGTIHTVEGYDYAGVKMKYDILNGRLHIKTSAKSSPRMMNPIHIKSFSIERPDSTFTFRRHLVPVKEVKNPMDVFFLELVAGEFYLLARPIKEVQFDNINPLAPIDDRRNVKYENAITYFVKDPSGKIIPYKNSKKIKKQIFGDSLQDLEKYAKQHKLRWGKPSDLTRIIRQANRL